MTLRSLALSGALSGALAIAAALPAAAAPVQWDGNGHWYEIVWTPSADLSWHQARDTAAERSHQGVTGYLATITSAAEQVFLNALNSAFAAALPGHGSDYITAWLGGSDSATEGAFEWVTGESFGYQNFAAGEPSNAGNQEDFLQGWWSGDQWNDCKKRCSTRGYVVEYDAAPAIAPVPVPATLSLTLAGLGALAFVARRRKARG